MAHFFLFLQRFYFKTLENGIDIIQNKELKMTFPFVMQ